MSICRVVIKSIKVIKLNCRLPDMVFRLALTAPIARLIGFNKIIYQVISICCLEMTTAPSIVYSTC